MDAALAAVGMWVGCRLIDGAFSEYDQFATERRVRGWAVSRRIDADLLEGTRLMWIRAAEMDDHAFRRGDRLGHEIIKGWIRVELTR